MDQQNQQLQAHIEAMRASGQSDEFIKQQLLASGWPAELLVHFFTVPAQAAAPLNLPTAAASAHVSKKYRFIIVALLAVIALLVGSLVYLALHKPASTANNFEPGFSKFTDPNFSVELPKSWSGDAGYEEGNGLTLFYSLESGIENLREQGANVTFYASDDSFDRIKQQLEGLEKAGGTYETIRDETKQFGAHSGRFVEVIVSTKEQPSKKMHLLSLSVKGKEKQYFADISALDEHWHIHAENAEHILNTFVPLK